jgi:hypothetical protein
VAVIADEEFVVCTVANGFRNQLPFAADWAHIAGIKVEKLSIAGEIIYLNQHPHPSSLTACARAINRSGYSTLRGKILLVFDADTARRMCSDEKSTGVERLEAF